MRYYCVLTIATGRQVYAGTSQAATAAALVPGTVYGYGGSEFHAVIDADRRRRMVVAAETPAIREAVQ